MLEKVESTTAVFQSKSIVMLGDPPLGSPVGAPENLRRPGINIWRFPISWPHQIFVRVVGFGGAAPRFWQRCQVHALNGPHPDGNGVHGEFVHQLGGSWVTPTGWSALEPRQTHYTYYFPGQYHDDGRWNWDNGLDYFQQRYSGGYLQRLSFNDNSDDQDFNDFIIEFAVIPVYRLKNEPLDDPKSAASEEPSLEYLSENLAKLELAR